MSGGPSVGLTIVTGFLGAGKTTLINRLLKDPKLADTAVVVNEFGEISIDHLLVAQASDGIIELGGGCLCCTVRGALVETLAELAGRERKLCRVVVETTGLADPVPMLQAVMAHPELSRVYRVERVVTVIDAVNGASTLQAHEEARSQAAVADTLVLSKADLVSRDALKSLLDRLAALNPHAEVLDAGAEQARSASLLDADAMRGARLPQGAAHGHTHEGHAHHHDAFQSVSLSHDRPLPFAAVENFLDLLATQQGDRILRIKGLVEIAEKPARPLLVQGVQKVLHAPEWLPEWPDGERGTRIVIIGRALDVDYVRRIFAAFAGQAGVDMPDRTAIEHNPLAVPGLRI